MAELKDIFALEAEREMPESWSKIHLYKVGDFWRAYEWSAWLVAVITYNDEVRMQTKDRKPLHVTRMRRTDVEGATYCSVGFPIRSLGKFIPQRENFESKEEYHAVVTIALPQPSDGSAITHDRLAEAMERWKEAIDIKQPTSRRKKATLDAPHSEVRAGVGLLSQIIAYPLEERTAMENMQFIRYLKDQVIAIL
jgi:hypothetical protein